MERRMVDINYVLAKFSVSHSSWYDMLNSKSKYFVADLPRPIRLGKRSVRWFEDELDAYLESRPRTAARPQGDR